MSVEWFDSQDEDKCYGHKVFETDDFPLIVKVEYESFSTIGL